MSLKEVFWSSIIAALLIIAYRYVQNKRAAASIRRGKCAALSPITQIDRIPPLIGPLHCTYCASVMFLERSHLSCRKTLRCPYCEIILLVPDVDWHRTASKKVDFEELPP